MTDDADDDFTGMQEYRRFVQAQVAKRFAKIIKAYGATVIDFYELPTVDEYGTVSLGDWGGYLVQVMPMLFNDRLVLTPIHAQGGYDHGWCYDKGGAAVLAALVWDPQTEAEPQGYKKKATGGVRQAGETAAAPGEVPQWLLEVAARWA